MAGEEVVRAAELGVKSREAQDIFQMLCQQNTKLDPVEYREQVQQFEAARARMHHAMNAHHAALGLLGKESK